MILETYLVVFVVFFAWLFYMLCIVVVPARRFAIVEQLGSFQRLLLPGWHVVYTPLQTLKSITWTYRDQQNKLQKDTFTVGSMDNQQLDAPPVSCMCRDKLVVEFDATAVYTVMNPKLACYEHHDVLNFFYQCLVQATRHVAAHTDASDLQYGDAVVVAKSIEDNVNEQITQTGLRCKRIILQNMKFAKDIVEREQMIYANKRQQEMRIAEERVEHERKMQALANEQARTELTNRIADEELRARLERRRKEYELERQHMDMMGWSPQDLLERERVQNISNVFAQVPQKVVFAPLEFWTKSHPAPPQFIDVTK